MFNITRLIFLSVAVGFSFGELTDEQRKEALDALYHENEMKLTPRQEAGLRHRVAIADNTLKWPNGTIPYIIDSTLSPRMGDFIRQAAEHIRSKTNNCIKYVPRRGEEKPYIRFTRGGMGCQSWMGMIARGAQDIDLGKGCEYQGTVLHEMLHAVGFDHEQSRPDRDQYLNIYWQNIQSGMDSQFNKTPGGQTFGTTFDFDSIMLYGEFAFSKQRGVLPTMQDKTGRHKLLEPFEKFEMTATDAYEVKRFYNCN